MDIVSLHERVLTLDSHIDIPWPNPPDPYAPSDRRCDMLKMRAGGLAAGCFAAYIPQGPQTEQGFAAASARAIAMLDAIGAMGGDRSGVRAIVASRADAIEAAHAEGALVVVPCVENGHAIGEDLSLLARFAERGARYMTLTHNGHNALADSAIPRADLADAESQHGGLSGLGREAVAEMNRLGLLVDVSHASRSTMLQAAARSKTPVVATHSCVRALCDHPRNLDDEQLDVLRATGGLIQITAMPPFLRPKGRIDGVGVADFCDHVDYVVARIGVAHAGISSDFDGGGAIGGWRDASETGGITAELVRRGYDEADVALLWGGNFLRLLRLAETAAAA